MRPKIRIESSRITIIPAGSKLSLDSRDTIKPTLVPPARTRIGYHLGSWPFVSRVEFMPISWEINMRNGKDKAEIFPLR